jgi:hypothetical protein
MAPRARGRQDPYQDAWQIGGIGAVWCNQGSGASEIPRGGEGTGVKVSESLPPLIPHEVETQGSDGVLVA